MSNESESIAEYSSVIVQVIGVAYTYKPSLAVRHYLTRNIAAQHSSKTGQFSYFYKGDQRSIVGDGQELFLRSDPVDGKSACHWPEAELAILLDKQHRIIAYTLANDLTAISIEARGRTPELDNTYEGKVWQRSGSLGPRFVPVAAAGDCPEFVIGLRIERGESTLYDQTYSTARRVREFQDIPDEIVRCYRSYGDSPPPSKRIALDEDGFLIAGSVIMLGTGLIVNGRYALQPGDRTTVYCASIGELTNVLVPAAQECQTTN